MTARGIAIPRESSYDVDAFVGLHNIGACGADNAGIGKAQDVEMAMVPGAEGGTVCFRGASVADSHTLMQLNIARAVFILTFSSLIDYATGAHVHQF